MPEREKIVVREVYFSWHTPLLNRGPHYICSRRPNRAKPYRTTPSTYYTAAVQQQQHFRHEPSNAWGGVMVTSKHQAQVGRSVNILEAEE